MSKSGKSESEWSPEERLEAWSERSLSIPIFIVEGPDDVIIYREIATHRSLMHLISKWRGSDPFEPTAGCRKPDNGALRNYPAFFERKNKGPGQGRIVCTLGRMGTAARKVLKTNRFRSFRSGQILFQKNNYALRTRLFYGHEGRAYIVLAQKAGYGRFRGAIGILVKF